MNTTSVIGGSTTAAPVAVDGAFIFFFHLKVIGDVLSTFVSIIICLIYSYKKILFKFFSILKGAILTSRKT